ncbi:S66 family peptidase [Pseudoalteromonas luteoviolacea]|uniref:Peptidase S66 n=1 Tax=Pseudoalteromonas luteoviolacea H33 TaxID=1365251 RepID=A0A162AEH7_9GAMM|nr:S66 peptidase family protein [Pseudoalteromonas luteoviolacea]KZN48423.1 hypothetical protein N476_21365 [Pseudoalteromonas luteoviolacea H33]KZN73284.1 hypothetical protein N477_23465 [Pseudoalteromonas luteoviolacea H33-S]
MIKPKPLQKGSNIAILAPSAGLSCVFPHIYQMGIKNLTEMGFNILEYPTTKMSAKDVFENPKARAEDINRAFADENVHGIISLIGGEDAARILKYLDPEIIQANPKLFMGYSDFSAVSVFLNQLGLVTFNGPSVMAEFAQLHNLSDEYRAYVKAFLYGELVDAILPTFSHFYDGYPDWSDASTAGQLNPIQKNVGPRFFGGNLADTDKVSGLLFGGCIEVLEMLKGTQFWPAADFWQGKVLFLETSQEKPSLDYVKYWLRNYGVMGVFEQLSGLLVGRARDYNEDEKAQLDEVILSVVREEFECHSLPIVTNLDFGHTDPQVILPLGCDLQIDVKAKQIKLLGSAFNS